MAVDDASRDNPRRAPRQSRARSGLGQGLGALIPQAEPTPQKSEKPLDVLFPDLTGAASRSSGQRGGSARDLLSPRGATKNVSRETISDGERERNSSSKRKSKQTRTDNTPRESTIVSRETISEDNPLEASAEGTLSAHVKETRPHSEAERPELLPVPGATLGHVPPSWIIPNIRQPRQVFDQDELEDLADSLSEVGLLQPVVVRRITESQIESPQDEERLRNVLESNPDARYELIMGERRWRAAQIAQLESLPIIVRETSDDELLREALIENIHRVQLNALEEAAAYGQLMEEFGYTQDELAKKVAKSRSQVANTLRLLRLPKGLQGMLAAGEITPGHARALLSMDSLIQMQQLASRIVAEGLSVRATEELAKFGASSAPRPAPKRRPYNPEHERVADLGARRLETSVKVSSGARKGKLVIEFADQEDLERIVGLLGWDE